MTNRTGAITATCRDDRLPGGIRLACTHKSGFVIDVRFTPRCDQIAAQQRNDAMC